MLRSPRATLRTAIEESRYLDLAALIVTVSAGCSLAFLGTRVGRLAALDQQVRQLESFGTVVTDQLYARVRAWEPYRPLVSGALIVVGWPLAWVIIAGVIRWIGQRAGALRQPTFAQVLTVVIHASAVLALRSVVTAPIDYVRESIGGATSLGMLAPGLTDGTFVARLCGAIDLFLVWWVMLVSLGLGMLYQTRASAIARWLFGAYATGAAALAMTQALRGGI